MHRTTGVSVVLFIILVALVCVLTGLAVAPLKVADDTMSAQAKELRGIGKRLAQANETLRGLQASSVHADNGVLVNGRASNQVTSFVQERVRRCILQAGGSIVSMQATSKTQPPGFQTISVLVRARFGESALMAFLHSIETLRPIMLFESLEVEPVVGPGGARQLTFTATISGFAAHAS